MTGRNQHHIPQFLQRGFGIHRSGKPKQIWKYEKGASTPELSEIKRTASDDDFYSSGSSEKTKTLDDQITELETPISRKIALLRQISIGSAVEPVLATEILIHLAPRTSHLRSVFSCGVTGLIKGASEIVTDKINLEALLGLDSDQPSARFQGHIANYVGAGSQFAQLGLPPDVLEQVVFRLAKENFDRLADEVIPRMREVLGTFTLTVPNVARDGHNEMLSKIIAGDSGRHDLLAYRWTVEAAPLGGAILPDCVAIAWLDGDNWRPFMGSSSKKIRSIIMPLCTSRLLIGSKEGESWPMLDTFNAAAAACSHKFFLASTDAHDALIREIGRVATIDIEEGLNGAIEENRPKRESKTVTQSSMVAPDDRPVERASASGDFTYSVSCFDFGDQELLGRIADTLKYLVAELSQIIPLDRLDGITFAVDYPAALSSIDRGKPNVSAAKSRSGDIGVGVAMSIPIERGAIIKAHIVLSAEIGLGLIDEVHQRNQSALHMLVHQLAEVSMMQVFDEALPNVILNPITGGYEGELFVLIHNALDGYAASRISACFGDSDEIMRAHQELLVATLIAAQERITKARLAYRCDGDLPRLIGVAQPLIEHILSFSAKLLGHADGLRDSPFDHEGVVKSALEKSSLLGWLKTFEADLRSYWDRRGRWKSLDELFRFNRHVERIFWQYGMFWSRSAEGGFRIDIPIAMDALSLLEVTGDSAPDGPTKPIEN